MTPNELGQHFVEHRLELLQAARKWLKTRYSALREDAVQDALVVALEAPNSYPDLAALKGLVELRAFLLFVRQRAIDRKEPPVHAWKQGGRRLVQYTDEGEPPPDPMDALADPGPSPEDLTLEALTADEIAAIGPSLVKYGATPDQQALFHLVYVTGLSQGELAEFLGINYQSAGQRSYRLRKLLRRVQAEKGLIRQGHGG